MSSENNVYTINKKNMKNIYEKLYNACNKATGVKKADKKAGMPFNPLLHDEVQRVAMAALLENRLYATCNYITDVTPKCVIVTCTMKITDIDDPKNFIIVDGCTAMGGLDKYGTGQAMSYSRKYAFLNALNLKTGLDNEDGYNAKPFEENSPEQSEEEPTYLDDEVNVEFMMEEISNTKSLRQLGKLKDELRYQVNYLKNNNPKAYEQMIKHTREHEVKLNNNQQ
jgi:hypothetical protein